MNDPDPIRVMACCNGLASGSMILPHMILLFLHCWSEMDAQCRLAVSYAFGFKP
jgi:hypothetical protein